MTTYDNPVKIKFYSKLDYINQLFSSSQNEVVLMFFNNSLAKKLSLEKHIEIWEDKCKKLIWIEKSNSYPTLQDVIHTLKLIRSAQIDAVYAIGGGSVIDTAKCCVALYEYRNIENLTIEDLCNIIKSKEYLDKPANIPIYATPTTAGTGSDVTKWATVWDYNNNKKYSIEADWLYPKVSYLVPELTNRLPVNLTITTGLDALCHACEAFWAKQSNPLIKELSLSAIKLIRNSLPIVIANPSNSIFREKMLLAATIAGLAFSQTRTTACHSISYPLTIHYSIDHGIACSLSLPQVMMINITEVPEIKEIIRIFAEDGGISHWMNSICEHHFKLSLSSFGVKEKDIPKLIEESYTKGRMDNNPVFIGKDELENIFFNIF